MTTTATTATTPTTPTAPAGLLAACGLAWAMVGMMGPAALAQGDPLAEPFPAVLELADLDGVIGLRLDGVAAGDRSGVSVASAGDLNGDGVGDIVIGAHRAQPDGRGFAGEAYVVFGRPGEGGFPAVIALDELDGINGLRLWGQRGDQSGLSVASAGDVNGDGVDDLAIGAAWARPGGLWVAGRTYIVYGRAGAGALPAVVDLAELDGTDGLRIEGEIEVGGSGAAVASAGDVNGDGVGDILIGAPNTRPAGGEQSGVSYIVFGRGPGTALPAALFLSDLDGTNGFRLDGIGDGDRSGMSLGRAGDVNGDGLDDVIIGSSWADPGAGYRAGQSYVIYGRSAPAGAMFPAVFPLAGVDGVNGFVFDGDKALDTSGSGVSSAGDLNGDGIDDVVIGALGARGGGERYTGEPYVVFGRRGAGAIPGRLDPTMLDGTNGFRIDGVAAGDRSGTSVASAGDVNGDGVDDLIIGAYRASPGGRVEAGQTAVVFGRAVGAGGGGGAGFPPVVALGELDGTDGFLINGVGPGDLSGMVVASAGDVNGDGVDDIIIGAYSADPGGREDAGSSYVIFGRRACRADVDGDGELTLFDFLAFQNLFDAGDPAADFDGDGALTLFDFLAFQNAFDDGCA